MKKFLRFLIPPCACFVLSWGAAHLVRTFAAVGEAAPLSRPAAAAVSAPKAPPASGMGSVAGRLQLLREAFDKTPPGQWSALWAGFAALAGREELEKLAGEVKTTPGRLAEEELAQRSGRAAGSPGAFAALAERDPEAAWRQVRGTGQSPAAGAVLRILASRDPEDALRRWREMPLRPEPRALTPDEALGLGRLAVTHSALGSLFASWARRDPAGADAAIASLPEKRRQEAMSETALAWSYHDGPAALRYVSAKAVETETGRWRMDVMLLSSLTRWPEETAPILKNDPLLKASTSDWGVPWAVPALWYLTDPDSYLAWFRESGKTASDLYFSKAILRNPVAAGRLLREIPLTENQNVARVISGIAQRDRAAGLALADEFHVLPAVESELRRQEAAADPGAGGADAPPAPATPPEGAKSSKPAFWTASQRKDFYADPAGSAGALLNAGAPLQDWDAFNAVSLWAPHDPEAARAWLSRLPEGRAKELGGLALANALTDRAPEEALTILSSLPGVPERDTEAIWKESLQRLLLSGGDWRKWLGRNPPEFGQFPKVPLEKALDREAALLELLQKSP